MLYACETADGARHYLILSPLATSVEEEMRKHGFVVAYKADKQAVEAKLRSMVEAAAAKNSTLTESDVIDLVFNYADMNTPIKV